MNRRTYISGLGATVAAGSIAGCTGTDSGNGDGTNDGDDTDGVSDDDSAYGILSTSVTDQPNDIDDFESLVVTIQGIWVKPAEADGNDEPDGDADSEPDDAAAGSGAETSDDGDGTDVDDDESPEAESDDADSNETDAESSDADDEPADESAGRYYIDFDEPQEADLVELQGDDTQLIDETELEVGEYQFLQLDVNRAEGVLEDGSDAVVETPGNAPLQFKHAFEIRAEEITRFIADFAPFRRGNGEYLIRPVASGTQVLYGDEAYEGGNDEEGDESDADEDDDTGSGSDAGPDGDPGQSTGSSGDGN